MPVLWSSSRISVPVMSLGRRSGVNWMRPKSMDSNLASDERTTRLLWHAVEEGASTFDFDLAVDTVIYDPVEAAHLVHAEVRRRSTGAL